MSFINWVIDALASEDVIDLYFILSDLVDVPISDDEAYETAYFDAKARHTAHNHKGDDNIPMGKRVY